MALSDARKLIPDLTRREEGRMVNELLTLKSGDISLHWRSAAIRSGWSAERITLDFINSH